MMNRIMGSNPLDRYEVATGETIVDGDMVALNASGKAVAASDAAGIAVIGVAVRTADGKVEIESGIVSIANDTTNALARADRGVVAYVKDKTTVDSTGGTNKVPAGLVVDVIDGEVYVDFSPGALYAARTAAKKMPVIVQLTADPAAATAATLGQIYIVKTGWTGGTRIATGTAGDVYISTGAAYVKLN